MKQEEISKRLLHLARQGKIVPDRSILKTPEHFIALGELADSSVNITVRAWVKSADYWDVYFDMNKIVYDSFNKEGIGFPFPQLTVHQAK